MRRLTVFVAVVLTGLFAATVRAQAPALRFGRVSVDGGLSHSVVTSFAQDRRGFLYIGSEGGLDRYDGATYTPLGDRLSSAFVHALLPDPEGGLWIGTYGGGLDRLDPTTGRIRHHRHAVTDSTRRGHDRILTLARDGAGRIWVGTEGGGLDRFDPATGRFTAVPLPTGRYRSIRALTFDRTGALYLGADLDGLARLDPATGRITPIPDLSTDGVSSLQLAADGSLWVGTARSGLARFDPATGRIVRYRHDPTDPASLPTGTVLGLTLDGTGTLWVATDGGGLARFDGRSGFATYAHNPADPTSLPSNRVRALMSDRTGSLWVGTWGGGLGQLVPTRFPGFRHRPGDPNSLSADDVSAVAEAAPTGLWVGTYEAGLNHVDRVTGRVTRFRAGPGGLGSDGIRSLWTDPTGRLWIGTAAGLDRLDPATGRITAVPALRGRRVRSLRADGKGKLYIAGMEGGVTVCDLATDRFTPLGAGPDGLRGASAYSLGLDRSGGVWVGTWGDGLIRLDPATGRAVARYRQRSGDSTGIGHNLISAVHPDRSGALWVATYGGGLDRFDPATGRFQHLTTRDGLPSDIVYSIEPDGRGRLWLSTQRGLVRLDPSTGTLDRYTPRDGLQSWEFNGGASLKLRSGELAFGSIGGLNLFDPATVDRAAPTFPVTLTTVEIDGQTLTDSTLASAAVRLPYPLRNLTFEGAGLDFRHPADLRYAHRLDGFDTAWIETGVRRYGTYTNLDPGSYRLRLRAKAPDGGWIEADRSLQLTLVPLFYQTGWFRVLMALAALGLVGWAARNLGRIRLAVVRRLPGTRTVGRYRLGRTLGSGGAGQVCVGKDLIDGREVAIKLLHDHLGDDPASRDRFAREGQLLSGFTHPHIVRVYETGWWRGTAFIAMERLGGRTLRAQLTFAGPLPVDQARLTFIALSDALEAVHRTGIVHRDLKGDNVMLATPTADGPAPAGLPFRPVLMDFGLARGVRLTTLTQLGAVLGTLGYVAPEQAMGLGEPDARSDLFSLGVLMYEATTGLMPFAGETEIAVLNAIFNRVPDPPDRLNGDVPGWWSDLILRCLEKDPDLRPQRAADVHAALVAGAPFRSLVSSVDPGFERTGRS